MSDGRIERQDLFSDEALKAPLEARKGFEKLEKQVDEVIKTSRQYNNEISRSNSTEKLKKQIKELTDEQKKMRDVHQQLIDKLKKQEAELQKLNKAQDKSHKMTKNTSEAMESLDQNTGGAVARVKELGKQLMVLAKSPVVLMLTLLVGAIAAVVKSVKVFYSTTDEGADQLERHAAVWDQFFITIQKGWNKLGKAASDFFGENGLKGLLFGVLNYFSPTLAAQFLVTADEADKMTKKLQDLDDELFKNQVSNAFARVQVNKLLEESQNRAIFTDEQRLKFLRLAGKISKESTEGDIALEKEKFQLLMQRFALEYAGNSTNIAFLRQQVDWSEQGINTLIDQINASDILGEKKEELVKAVITLIDMEANYYAQQRRITSQISALQLESIQARIKADREYLDTLGAGKDEELRQRIELNKQTLEENKINFLERVQLLVEQYDLEENLLQSQKEKELEIVKRAAEDKIRAEGIFDPQKIKERLAQDEIYQQQRTNIYSKYNFLQTELFKDLTKTLDKEEKSRASKSFALAQSHLDAEIKQIEDANKKKLEEKQKLNEALLALEQQLITSTVEIVNNGFDRQIERYNQQLDALTRTKEQELAAVGDNEEAKAKIVNDYAAQEQQIRDQLAQTERRKAIFDKAQAAFQVGINTALAISKVVAQSPITFGLPWSAIIAGIGAAQLAAILTRPIPSYAIGTDNHPGGLARVGERGSELVHIPGVGSVLTPNKETLMYLPKGSQVETHDETMRALALNGLLHSDRNSPKKFSLEKAFNKLEYTIRNKKELHWNISRNGVEKIISNANSKNKILNKFYA